jgi:hypothetical protein
MMEPPVKKTEVPTAVYFDSATKAAARRAAGYSRPFLDNSPSPIATDGVAGLSPAKKTKTNDNSTQPAAAQNDNSFLQQQWALAAERQGTDNAFEFYLASIAQLSQMQPQQQQHQQQALPQLQQQPPQPQPASLTWQQPIASKHAPLTKAKRNKKEARELVALVNEVQLDDEEDEIYDSCPEVAEKINQFLLLDGVNKKIFLEDAMDQSECYVMLKTFIEGVGQSQCANKLYGKA